MTPVRSLKTGLYKGTMLVGNTKYAPTISVEYLIVAGGGGGANYGGGGAGQVTNATTTFRLETAHTVTIGAGGSGYPETDGNNSSITGTNFTTVTASKGLKPAGTAFQAAGTSGNGFTGGLGRDASNPYLGGGGGGASANGSAAAGTTAGNGGAGVANSITGSSVTYGGGGGGGAEGNGTRGTGGSGGGGNGYDPNTGGSNGTANTGGGGGGGKGTAVTGSGGSGYLVLKYLTADGTLTIGAGLTGSISTSGSYKIATITAGTGTVTFN